jgi:hypothetical protein
VVIKFLEEKVEKHFILIFLIQGRRGCSFYSHSQNRKRVVVWGI